MKTVIIEERAEAEVKDAFLWCLQSGENIALEFYELVTQTVNTIAKEPKIGRALNTNLRKFSVSKFPYCIIYREEAEAIYLVAFSHHKRRPEF